MKKFQIVLLLWSLSLAVSVLPSCRAQVIDPVTAAQAPVPGSGHSYIGIGSETVNPADGSVEFYLPIKTPPGRGLSFPFGIRYSSSSPFFVTASSSGGGWTTAIATGEPPPFDLNGWSYQLPYYSAQAFVSSAVTQESGCNYEFCGTDYCWSTDDMAFSGFDGQSHPLQLSYGWPDLNNPDPPQPNNPCPGLGPGDTNPSAAGWGDYQVFAGWGSPAYNPTYPTTQPPVVVTDRSGTVYNFQSGPVLDFNPAVVSGPEPFGVLAGSITDRNGNQIVLNGTNSWVTDGTRTSMFLQPGSYTDTLGRTVVSWTGLGSASGDQITVSGVGTVTVKWTTTTVTFPTNYQSPVPSGSGASTCVVSSPEPSITMSVVSEIDLPGGQKYSFTYGGLWGLLTRITFPGGGYVNYTWGSSTLSTAAYSSWPLDQTQPYATGNAFCFLIIDTPAIVERDVSYDGSTIALSQTFNYGPTSWVETATPGIYWTSKSTTVSATDEKAGHSYENDYTYSSVPGPGDSTWHSGAQVPVEQSVVYRDGDGNILKVVNKNWADRYSWIASQTIPSGDTAHATTTIRCIDNSDRVLGTYEYGFSANGGSPAYPSSSNCLGYQNLLAGLNTTAIGQLLRQTQTAYAYPTVPDQDEPSSITVCNSSVAIGSCNATSSAVRQTVYQYDQFQLTPSGVSTTLLVGAPGSSRGNVTSVSRWLNTASSWITTEYSYYDTGQIYTMTDPCGTSSCTDMNGSTYTTTYSYSDSFAPGTGSPPNNEETFAYLTLVTDPRGHKDSFTWGYNDGQVRSHTDPNTQTTNYSFGGTPSNCAYQDYLDRLTEVQGPPDPNNGNQRPTTTYCYNDSGPNPSITTTETLDTSGDSKISIATMDGMGHTVQTERTSSLNPDPVYVDTIYDGMGELHQQSNPTRCTSSPGTLPASCPAESTWGYTTFNYDGLGREILLTHSPDGSSQWWQYSGPTVSFTNENSNQWNRTSDALGRLVQVSEPDGATKSPSIITSYTYDLQDNLLSVLQSGTRLRSFNYDSLSRLLCASNPENSVAACPSVASGSYVAGTTGYSYDANGNLEMKTDARGVTTNYSYDNDNRLLAKTFTNAPAGSLSSCYQFDTASNGAGRLGSEWTQSGLCSTSPPSGPQSASLLNGYQSLRVIGHYDPMGRVVSEQQCVFGFCTSVAPPPDPAGNCTTNGLSYCYDLAGNLTAFSNGLNSTAYPQQSILFSQQFDAAGRLSFVGSSLTGTQLPGCLFNAQSGTAAAPCSTLPPQPAYSPFGNLLHWTLGNGVLSVAKTYDNRLRVTGETATQQ